MNFEDLQSAWKQDEGTGIKLPDHLGKLKRATSPVEKVKKNIRLEMWVYLCFTIIFFALPFLYERLIPQAQVFYYTILVLTLLPITYYFYNFYRFYKRLNRLELNTMENVEDAYFDLRYSIEIYKVMQHFISPNFFLMGFVFGLGSKIEKVIDQLIYFSELPVADKLATIGVGLGILLVFVGYFYLIKFMIQYSYGKYLDELKEIKESLREK